MPRSTRTVAWILFLGLCAPLAAAGPPFVPAAQDTDYYDDGAPPQTRVELGRLLFFDKILSGNLNISCASCHHPLAGTGDGLSLPVGKGDNQADYDDGHDDFGRERVSGQLAERFRFRTPALRNIALTAPYGHAGAYNTLEAVVRHYIDPANALRQYATDQAVLPSRPDLDALDFVLQNDPDRLEAIAAANESLPIDLGAREVQDLLAFLHALTDPASLDMRADVPPSVPSGLPVWD
jgi:cytochrome c peroxidase